jgi:hypothetical protein
MEIAAADPFWQVFDCYSRFFYGLFDKMYKEARGQQQTLHFQV